MNSCYRVSLKDTRRYQQNEAVNLQHYSCTARAAASTPPDGERSERYLP